MKWFINKFGNIVKEAILFMVGSLGSHQVSVTWLLEIKFSSSICSQLEFIS